MSKQTAVEWLRKMLEQQIPEQMDIVSFWLKVAERREKNQIIDAYIEASPRLEDITKEAAEEYYQETYGTRTDADSNIPND